MRSDTNYSGPTLHVKQIKSAIAHKPKNRGTLRALGLRKIGDTNVLPDRPEIRGMIARIPTLITVVEVGAVQEVPATEGKA
jgi:large subunit ribosomal protein L30